MLLPKPSSMRMAISLFVVAVVMIPLAGQLRHRRVSAPETPEELMALLSQEEPSLHVVPVLKNNPDHGMYICTQPQPLDSLVRLLRIRQVVGPRRYGRWEGVVYCERVGNLGVIEAHEIRSWGEYGMQIGRLLFFGDPDLLERIRAAILDGRAIEKKSNYFPISSCQSSQFVFIMECHELRCISRRWFYPS